MNIFEQYGIKEVADVTLYSIHKKTDGSGDVYYVPALFLDTLKVSTTEQTGENVWAQGGKGNVRLVNWDYNKTINVTLEDALCTPASLGLCYGGILSADWENGHVKLNSGISNSISRISIMEPASYPRSSLNPNDSLICKLLPQSNHNKEMTKNNDYLINSDVVDGTRVQGVGQTLDRSYRWRLIIESRVRSIAQVPDRFFDLQGRSYSIEWNSKVSVFNGEAPTYSNFKDAIIYKIGPAEERNNLKPFIIFDAYTADKEQEGNEEINSLKDYLTQYDPNVSPTIGETALVSGTGEDEDNAYNIPAQNKDDEMSIKDCDYLAIVVDNDDNYHAFVGIQTTVTREDKEIVEAIWYKPKEGVNVNQFKGLDMWIKFDGINELIYFLLTKYEQDIIEITTSHMTQPNEEDSAVVNNGTTIMDIYNEEKQHDGRLWAYVNPRTMKPYLDDYWFHNGEPYYIKSLTIANNNKQINGQKIVIKADTWPGSYMMVGETYIRNRDTGKDEHMQIVIPQAKVKSDQTLTLQADGEPTVFNLSLEVAQPRSKTMMEINTYETELKMVRGEDGYLVAADGSSVVKMM